MKLVIVAALPREIVGLVKGVPAEAGAYRQGIAMHRVGHALVVAAGMGPARATMAVQAAFQHFAQDPAEPVTLLSIGLAGACDPARKAGDVVEAGNVVDVRTGERFATAAPSAVGLEKTVLATSLSLASVSEKQRLWESYGACLVDMEAATVARLAEAHGAPFRAIKAISDSHDFELEALAQFASSGGKFRTGAFALHTAVRPHRWGPTMRLGRHSKLALGKLTAVLRDVIANTERG